MTQHPSIQLGDWISIGVNDCVVAELHQLEERATRGLGVVVFKPDKPTSREFDWNGKEFCFFERRSDFGGYAEHFPTYAPFVRKLKRGRH